MNFLPDMSTSIDTRPSGRLWLDKPTVDKLQKQHVFCRVVHDQTTDDGGTRLFYDLLGSPYMDNKFNDRLKKMKTSVLYSREKFESIRNRFGWSVVKGQEVFCKFVVVDGVISTLSMALPAQQSQQRA